MDSTLSRREREVADLVAEGLTNREIAERLVISERTAEGHVEQIRNKLGFHSRAQVAGWVASERARPTTAVLTSWSPSGAAVVTLPPRARLPHLPRLPRRIVAVGLSALLVVIAALAFWPRQAPAGLVVVAGNGNDGFSGDGGSAVFAQLSDPTSMAFDHLGNLLFADSVLAGHATTQDLRTRVRRIDAKSGVVNTIVGQAAVLRAFFEAVDGATLSLGRGSRMALGPQDELYVADGAYSNGKAWVGRIDTDSRFTWIAGGTNVVAPLRTTLLYPRGLAVGPDDTLYVSDSTSRVLAIPRDGAVRTIAGTGDRGATGDGGPATSATLYAPLSIRFSPDGSLYIADTNNYRIRAIDHGGIITTIVGDGTEGFRGDGGPATRARLSLPSDIAFGRDGVLYIADTGNARVRAVAKDGTITTVAGPDVLVQPTALAVHPDGTLYIADTGAHRIYKLTR